MPIPPLSSELDEMLRRPNPAVMACIRPDGTPLTCAVWYHWEDGRVTLTFDARRKRLAFIKTNPNVSICSLDRDDWFKNVALFGRVVDIHPDTNLRETDQIALDYIAKPYPDREKARVIGVVEVDTYFAWNAKAEVGNL